MKIEYNNDTNYLKSTIDSMSQKLNMNTLGLQGQQIQNNHNQSSQRINLTTKDQNVENDDHGINLNNQNYSSPTSLEMSMSTNNFKHNVNSNFKNY